MDVLSAMRSGKRYKPKTVSRWFEAVPKNRPTLKQIEVPIQWLLCEEWEIEEKEPEVTISRSEFLTKMRATLRDWDQADKLAVEIGLG
jgi:hypothetical protein